MVKKEDWGPVYCIDGPHKGRIGYYDDDDWDETLEGRNKVVAVVYWGDPIDCDCWSLVPRKYLTSKITMAQIMTRQEELRHLTRQTKSNRKKVLYMIERLYVESLFYDKHIEGNYHSKKTKGLKLFVSYNIEDYTIASYLRIDLLNEGYEVWMDQWEIVVGQSIVHEVNDAMAKCDFMLLLLSKAALKSYWVNKEWQSMFMKEIAKRDVIIMPLLLEECEIPALLKEKKYANFKNGYPRGLDQVLDALQRLTKNSSAKNP